MAKYKTKQVIVEAQQMENDGEVFDYLHSVSIPYKSGDWIITGTEGEKYPCVDSVFKKKYEPVDG